MSAISPIRAAVELAERGLACFPCLETKAPACPTGFKAATNDADQLHDLFRRHPGPLIGVVTGAASGFDVVDLDGRNGAGAWWAENRAKLPQTRIHRTRSRGLHLLFRHREGIRNSAGRIAPGLDVRGDGGFIIWWPAAGCSIEHDGPLAPWPDWLAEAALPRPATTPPPASAVPYRGGGGLDAASELIARVLARLEMAGPGEKHERLRAASRAIGGVMAEVGISAASAEAALFSAVMRAGGAEVREVNARGTIRWGLEQGARAPINLGDR